MIKSRLVSQCRSAFLRLCFAGTVGVCALACCIVTACSNGLEPAKNGDAVVSLSLASLPGYVPVPATDGSGRAVVQGGGYLYIRMLGGPDGVGAKKYYGPYSVSGSATGGSTFITRDIPAGSYDGMFVLYAADPVHENLVPGLDASVADFLAFSDDIFRDSLGDFSVLDDALNDSSSVGLIPAFVLYPGTINSVSLTLRPATSLQQPAVEEITVGNGEDQNERNRVFVRTTGLVDLFSGIDPGDALLRCFIYNSDRVYPVSLSVAAAYRPSGARASGSVASPVQLAADQQTFFDVEWDGSDEYYVYADFVGRSADIYFETVQTKQYVPIGGSFTCTESGYPAYYSSFSNSAEIEVYLLTTPATWSLVNNVSDISALSQCVGYGSATTRDATAWTGFIQADYSGPVYAFFRSAYFSNIPVLYRSSVSQTPEWSGEFASLNLNLDDGSISLSPLAVYAYVTALPNGPYDLSVTSEGSEIATCTALVSSSVGAFMLQNPSNGFPVIPPAAELIFDFYDDGTLIDTLSGWFSGLAVIWAN